MSGKIYNENSFECLADIVNECLDPVIVTDPPFNIGYHYRTYRDKVDEGEYFESMAQMFNEYPSVVVLYPEALHRLSHEMGRMPDRVVSWVYPSNTRKQHRDIGFYGVEPRFEQVRRPYKNPNDKRIRELVKRTGGGVAPMTGWKSTRSRTSRRRRQPIRARCRSKSCEASSGGCHGLLRSSIHLPEAEQRCSPPSLTEWNGEP